MKHILLIEDNDEVRENTAEILELANYIVVSASNGKEGIEAAMKQAPDIIICDVMMPVLDGYGVLHLLNKNPELSGIPFIFLTAKAERNDLRKGMEMGADDYITKPFSDVELLNAVESRLKKTELLRQNFAGKQDALNQFIDTAKQTGSLENLKQEADVNTYKKKQIIYSEGNYPNKLFYIIKGRVRTFKSNDFGKELTISLFGEGDFLGYTALLENSRYKESAEAMNECEISMISKEDFETLINSSREVALTFIRMLAKNVTDKEQQLISIAYNSLRKKVADALINLCDKYKGEKDKEFSINISREELAKLAGTVTESLIRTLSDFKSEKLVAIKEGLVVILNENKLREMLN
ncbi:hypothetical protein BH09BAC2_BH09BAC2_17740 [soil metagenome]